MEHLPNILIVDDTRINLTYIEAVIKKIKVNLIQALSGYQALEKTRGVELALAIIDVRMPGMNGYELALKMNEERFGDKVPVIFLTANYFNEMEMFKGYDSGAVDYIFKPIDNHILLSKINVFLELYDQKQKIISDSALLKESADELARVNAALKKSEEKYRSYIDNAPDGVFVADETGRYLEVNEAACRITGYSKEELFNRSFSDILPAESLEEGLAQFRKVVETGTSKADLLFEHKNGTRRWWVIECVKLAETRFLCFTKDITERKQAEASLRESEEKYHKLFTLMRLMSDTMPDMLWAKDLSKQYIFTNRAICENLLNAVDTTEPVGKTDLYFAERERYLHPENPDWHTFGELCMDSDAVTLEEMKEMQFDEFGNVKGEYLYLDVHKAPMFNIKGELIGVVGSARDITERKLAEKARQEALWRMESIIEGTHAGTWEWNIQTGEMTYNEVWAEIIGYTLDELAPINSKTLEALIFPEDLKKSNELLERHFTGEMPYYDYEFKIRHKEGHWVWIHDRGRVITRNEDGKPLMMFGIHTDITERKRAEKTLNIMNERYNLALNAGNFGVWDADVEKNILIWDDRMLELYGLTKTEFGGNYESWLQRVHPEDAGRCNLEILKLLESGKDYNTVFRIILPDGTVKFTKCFGYVARDSSGKPIRLTGVNFDISDSKLKEEEIDNSKKQLEKYAQHLQNIREEERKILARQIHDELGQILIAMKIDIGLLKQKVLKYVDKIGSEDILVCIDHLFVVMDKTIKTTRKIMTELRPEMLDALGFIETVKSHSKEFQERYQITCKVECRIPKLNLNADQSVALFRIFQEALTNVARHSGATEVKIYLKLNNNKLVMEIVDNGKGFPEDQKFRSDSYGIIGMKERAFLLHGELTVAGNAGKGVCLRIEIPYS